MLVEMAIGDSYGAAFEFMDKPFSQHGLTNDGVTYQQHPVLPIGNAKYTDDTQMALAIAEMMVENPEFTREQLADKFVWAYKRDPRNGYGKRFHQVLTLAQTGADLFELLLPDSTRSGGAMRVGPIGLYPSISEVLTGAALQASITHNSPQGIMAAQAVATMVHFFAYQLGTQSEVGDFLEMHVPGHPWGDDHVGWATVEGIPCAHAAITAVRNGATQHDILLRAVEGGGDVDTVAAIAMFAASLIRDLPKDLPKELYDNLERGKHGYDYLINRDIELRGLFEAFGRGEALTDWKSLPEWRNA